MKLCRRSDRRNQLARILIAAGRFGRLPRTLVELAAFAREIALGVDDQQGGAVCVIGGRFRGLSPIRIRQ
jgi:hypothetical protein